MTMFVLSSIEAKADQPLEPGRQIVWLDVLWNVTDVDREHDRVYLERVD